jgi:hypothetical protein
MARPSSPRAGSSPTPPPSASASPSCCCAWSDLQRLYYDTALSASEYKLAALRQFVPASQVLFGSDFPLASESIVAVETSGLESSRLPDAETRRAIHRHNALTLFLRFGNSRDVDAQRMGISGRGTPA